MDVEIPSPHKINTQNFKKVRDINPGSVILVENTETSDQYIQYILPFQIETPQQRKEFLSNITDIFNIMQHPSFLPLIGFSYHDLESNPTPTILTNLNCHRPLSEIIEKDSEKLTETNKFIIIYGMANIIHHLCLNKLFNFDFKIDM